MIFPEDSGNILTGELAWASRTISSGTYYAITWNGSLSVAVGLSVCSTSPDGITWTSRTIPSGDYYGITWDGSLFVAVGYASVCITSPAN